MTNLTIEVPCPTCQKKVKWNEDFPFKPFCSERCKLIDLGAWSSEEYSIPLDEKPIPDDTIED